MNTFKSFLGLLVLLAGSFFLYKIVPPYWANYKLGRLVETQSIEHTYTKESDEQIANAICEQARQFDLQLTPGQVVIERGGGNLSIQVDYSITLDMLSIPLDLKFHVANQNHNVMMR